ncbi:MAG: hypothetical protein ACI8U3_001280 [Brevundimonas sp.]|jgi:hypothetical protein|uniref:ATP-binding protein n=1 Tax=Brevundimonas sp. TaxID=1871086 RepID=UPI0039E45474
MTHALPESSPVLRYAALSARFDPRDALQLANLSSEQLLETAALLGAICDTAAGKRWLMRPAVRRRTIEALAERGELHQALEERSSWPGYDADARALGELLRGGFESPHLLSDPELRSTLEAVLNDRQPSSPKGLSRLWGLLAMAAPVAGPAMARRAQALIDLSLADLRASALLGSGFEGRQDERERLETWLRTPTRNPPLKALYVQGLPAIGKSSLLERVIFDPTALAGAVVIRLDFDRTGLDPRDRLRMTVELARQLAAQAPSAAEGLNTAVRGALRSLATGGSSARDVIPEDLVRALRLVLGDGRHIAAVLDTLESLDARGPRQVEQLFAWLDDIMSMTGLPISVVAGGRGEGRSVLGPRLSDQSLVLDTLPPDDQYRLMARMDVPENLRAPVASAAEGNPLRLKMAARLALEDPHAIPEKSGMDAAHLYRSLQSRIADPRVRELLDPGLLLRRLDRESFRGIIAPFFRLGTDPQFLDPMFKALVAQSWLFEPDRRQDGWFRQPEPVRKLIASLMSSGSRAKSLHRQASRWLMQRPSVLEQADGLFHRLQGGWVPEPAAINPDLAAQFDEAMLEELSHEARRAILWVRGDLSSRFDSIRGADRSPSRSDARNLAISLNRGVSEEAEYLFRETFESRYIDPQSEQADVQRAFLWRSGRWKEAIAALRERDLVRADDFDLPDLIEALPRDIAFCRAEMRAETAPHDFTRTLSSNDKMRGAFWELFSADSFGRLRGGATDFLVRQIDIRAQGDRRGDVVEMTMGVWANGGWDSIAGELHVPFPPGDDPPDSVEGRAEICRTLARFNPIAAPVRTYIGRQEVEDRIAEMPMELKDRIEERAPLVYESLPTGFDSLVATGWFAEWLSMEAYHRRDGNLSVLSQRAEAWRQTIAGRWRFGFVPRYWDKSSQTLDVVITARIARLLREPSPTDEAFHDLRVWGCSLDDPRLAKRVDQAARAIPRGGGVSSFQTALAAARRLRSARTPVAVIPALAVLAARW